VYLFCKFCRRLAIPIRKVPQINGIGACGVSQALKFLGRHAGVKRFQVHAKTVAQSYVFFKGVSQECSRQSVAVRQFQGV
jgi:hypothetical protein